MRHYSLALMILVLTCVLGQSYGQICATDAAVEQKLKDANFIQKQVSCIVGTGKCNGLGRKLKRKVPEVIKGICPKPCKPCDQKQIQKIIKVMQDKYPAEWASILNTYNGK